MKPICHISCRLLTVCLMWVISFEVGYGQYGLGFAGQEVMQDRRTGLSLNKGQPICFRDNFELSFDLSFFPNRPDYFGYVVRIIDEEGHNVDLLFDKRMDVDKRFRVVYRGKFSAISFDIPPDSLFDHWTAIRIKFDGDREELCVYKNQEKLSERIPLKKGGCYTVLFGLNDHERFNTIDVPAMKLRNILLSEAGKTKAFWSLDGTEGTEIWDQRENLAAGIVNPLWQKKRHQEWENVGEFSLKGYVNVAFDPIGEDVYLVSNDSLIAFGIDTHKATSFRYTSGRLNLGMGNQALFDTVDNRLLDFSIDKQVVSQYDFNSRRWTENFSDSLDDTNYWHANKLYFAGNRSLYTIGGYGHFQFRSDIWQYDERNRQWKLTSNNMGFAPRYLAALGATEKGAYILGGYGSNSGQQMLNAQNYYDLWFFDPAEGTVNKLHEFAALGENSVFANSLVIDSDDQSFYGLIFPKNVFNSHLQLVRGNLKDYSLLSVGGRIPYQFHDVHSFADLFFTAKSKQFVAVTLFNNDSNVTVARVYTLYAPPLPVDADQEPIATRPLVRLMVGMGILLLLLVAVILGYAMRKKKRAKEISVVPKDKNNVDPPIHGSDEADTYTSEATLSSEEKRYSAIFLFGNMQLFDKEGSDITRLLTPLIKELFLTILLHTTKRDGGISSEKLFELLWFDKSIENARNNMSVSIARLKSILAKIGECKISKKTGYWRVEIKDPQIYIDYWEYLKLVGDKNKLNKQTISQLSKIVQRGAFLSQSEYEWLDSFKSEVSNEIIDAQLHVVQAMRIQDDPEFIIQVANNIFFFDPVNEEAMTMKCKALSYLGKHSLAMQTFESFRKEYLHIYGEEFGKEFRQVIQ